MKAYEEKEEWLVETRQWEGGREGMEATMMREVQQLNGKGKEKKEELSIMGVKGQIFFLRERMSESK